MAGQSKWANIQHRKRRQAALRGADAAAGSADRGAGREPVRHEGHAPGGIAVIVDCLTDDKARTATAVHDVFARFGGSVAGEGTVAFMFKPLGVLAFAPGADEVALAEAALAAGADDVLPHPDDGAIDVLTSLDVFESVREKLQQAGFTPDHAEITMRADIDVGVSGDAAKQVVRLIESLEDLDDVQNVYTNAELSADAYT